MIQVDQTYARDLVKQAFVALLEQGAYGVTSAGVCTYLNSKGQSCIAGLALKIADPEIDLQRLFGAIVGRREVLLTLGQNWDEDALILAQAAQRVHDRCAYHGRDLTLSNLLGTARKASVDFTHQEQHIVVDILKELQS